MDFEKNGSILVIDDDQHYLNALENTLSLANFAMCKVTDPQQAAPALQQQNFDCVLLDLSFPGYLLQGTDVLKEIVKHHPDLPVIVNTAVGTIRKAVSCLKEGAYNIIEKGEPPERLIKELANACEFHRERQKMAVMLAEQFEKEVAMIGESPQMKQIFRLVSRIAPTPAKVLLQGEHGTGKELLAKALHRLSNRNQQPFVTVNSSAIPGELLESELFGHCKGAFTGAVSDRVGKFEAADGGTLFLDEIGDMSFDLQVKLLRALETQVICRVGEEYPRAVDVRVISATNKNLEQLVDSGVFRADLYFRLKVLKIEIPPLRERKEDILPLIRYFLQQFKSLSQMVIQGIAPEAMEILQQHSWPGNVRELRNVMEALVILSDLPVIPESLVLQVLETQSTAIEPHPGANVVPGIIPLEKVLERCEERYIRNILESGTYQLKDIAEALAIDRTTLFRKIQKYGLNR